MRLAISGGFYFTGSRVRSIPISRITKISSRNTKPPDIDFAMKQITIRDGKGEKDRITMLPNAITESLHRHLAAVRLLHEQDLAEGFGDVYLPYALERKYRGASRTWE
jgi:hypothetical protein